MTSSITIQKNTPILTSPSDWDSWFSVIRSKAKSNNIWQFIDPTTKKEDLPKLVEPRFPLPTMIKPTATTDESLTSAELLQLMTLRADYPDAKKQWRHQKQALLNICVIIKESIAIQHLVYVEDCDDSAYEMIKALHLRLAPTDQSRKAELIAQYHKLGRFTKGSSVDDYLRDWESTYNRCKLLNIAEVQDERPLFDFVRAISAIAPNWSNPCAYSLNEKLQTGANLPTIHELIAQFRIYHRQRGITDKSSYSAFGATYQGQNNSNNSSNNQSSNNQRDSNNRLLSPPSCICGRSHQFGNCYYYNSSIRPTGWTPDPEIMKKVNDFIKNRPEMSDQIKQSIERNNKRRQSNKSPASDEPPKSMKMNTFALVANAITDHDHFLKKSVIIDSGSDTHVCNNFNRLSDYKSSYSNDTVYAGATRFKIHGYGTMKVMINDPDEGPRDIYLTNAAYIPGFHTNIASLDRFVERDVHLDTEIEAMKSGGQIFCQIIRKFRHWILEYNPISNEPNISADSSFSTDSRLNSDSPSAPIDLNDSPTDSNISSFATNSRSPKVSNAPEILWHQRLGHPSPEVMNHINESTTGAIISSPNQSPNTIECETCALSKAHHIISRRPRIRSTEAFERVHFDLIQMTQSFDGFTYILHFLCDYTAYHFAYILASKSQTTDTIYRFITYIDRQFRKKIRYLHSDQESSLGNEFERLLSNTGIQWEPSAVDTPAQNGSAERSGGVILTKARTIRINANLPEFLWPEAIKSAVYLLNRTPTKALNWKTPYEMIMNRRPDISHIRIYGCRAYPLKRDIQRTRKLESRAYIGYLVGYESSNIFRIWLPKQMKVIATRDVTFNEDLFYDPNDQNFADSEAIKTVEILDIHTDDEADTDEEDEEITLRAPPTNPTNPTDSSNIAIESIEPNESNESDESLAENINLAAPSEPMIYPTPSASATPESDSKSIKSKKISSDIDESNIIQDRRSRKPRKQVYFANLEDLSNDSSSLQSFYSSFSTNLSTRSELHRDHLPEPPKNWKDILNHRFRDEFQAAAQVEIDAISNKSTWEIINKSEIQSKSNRPLPLKWVFTYKFDTNGYLTKFKARICVRGDLQPIYRDDTYAATLAAKTFRSLMAITAKFDLEASQLDAINAFTNAELDEEVYTELPPGFDKPGYILRLKRALYGLRRSPRLWHQDLSSALSELGLSRVNEDHSLFTNDWLIIFFYVDDIVALYRKQNHADWISFKSKLMKRFEMRDIGELKWFLNIRIIRDRMNHKLWLCQDSYIDKIANSFNLAHRIQKISTPLPTIELQENESIATAQEIHAYQRRIGSILYAAIITRPDISFAVSKLSTYLTNPSPIHMSLADRIITYLYNSKYLAIKYSADSDSFIGASDAAFADDSKTRRSSEGFIFHLFGGAIDWKASKQSTVTTSSTEAELLALSHASKEYLWWKRLFANIRLTFDSEPIIHCDNKQTIRLICEDEMKLQTKLKHVDIHQHWLRQEIKNKSIRIDWIKTADMPADGFTKPLPNQRHQIFIKQLNLRDISSLIRQLPIHDNSKLGGCVEDSEG